SAVAREWVPLGTTIRIKRRRLIIRLSMNPRKVLAPILLAIGLVGINPSLTRADTKPIEMKRIHTSAQDVADLKALEDRFITAFRAKDVNTIMQLCVPDESLVVFDVTPPLERKGADAYRTRTFLFRSIYGQAKQISNRGSRAGVRG
ncbi:MAG: hypothetical protein WAM44_15190, partial [Chthoniobacterales bacterium]